MAYPILALDPTTVNETEPSHTLNVKFYSPDTGKTYRYIKNAGAANIAAGDVVGRYDSSGHTAGYGSCTAATILDAIDGTTTRNQPIGIGIGAITSGRYGFVQTDGPCTAITTDGNVVKGQFLVAADGAIVASANGTAATAHLAVWGQAFANNSSTTLANAQIWIP